MRPTQLEAPKDQGGDDPADYDILFRAWGRMGPDGHRPSHHQRHGTRRGARHRGPTRHLVFPARMERTTRHRDSWGPSRDPQPGDSHYLRTVPGRGHRARSRGAHRPRHPAHPHQHGRRIEKRPRRCHRGRSRYGHESGSSLAHRQGAARLPACLLRRPHRRFRNHRIRNTRSVYRGGRPGYPHLYRARSAP